jgi:hypothetical protein
VDGTWCLHWHVYSLPHVMQDLPLHQPLQLDSNVASDLDGNLHSYNNGSLLDSNDSATCFKWISNAYRGDGISNDAFKLGHQANIYLD